MMASGVSEKSDWVRSSGKSDAETPGIVSHLTPRFDRRPVLYVGTGDKINAH